MTGCLKIDDNEVINAGRCFTGGYAGSAIGDTFISSAATWNAKTTCLGTVTGVTGTNGIVSTGGTAPTLCITTACQTKFDQSGCAGLACTGNVSTSTTGDLTLDISGDVDIDGTLETDNLTVGGSQGSDGQVLTSTGSGVAWEDASGGGGASAVNDLSDAKTFGATWPEECLCFASGSS
mgnify:CR=1 FL=1